MLEKWEQSGWAKKLAARKERKVGLRFLRVEVLEGIWGVVERELRRFEEGT